MAFQLPQSRNLRQIQIPKRNIPVDQIIGIEGQNPLATGVETAGNLIGQALTKKAQLRMQGEQLAALASMAGEPVPNTPALTPEMYEKGLSLQTSARDKKANAAKERVQLELQLEKIRKGYTEIDPLSGKQTVFPGNQGFNIEYDEAGNPFVKRDENYNPGSVPKSTGGGGKGLPTLSNTFVDTDGTPLSFHRDTQTFTRTNDGRPPIGTPVPFKGNKEATTDASRGAVLLGAVDKLETAFKTMPEAKIRASLTPGVGAIAFPEIKQLRSELEQAGFSFGGKNFTGNEKAIIVGAMIPGPLDNDASRVAKFNAIRQYVAGNIDLLQAANLLGPSGAAIKSLIDKNSGLKKIPVNETTDQRKARLIQEAQGTLR